MLTIIITSTADDIPYFGGMGAGSIILTVFINITFRLRGPIVIEVRIIEVVSAGMLIDLVINLMSMAYFRRAMCIPARLWNLDKLQEIQKTLQKELNA